MAKKTAKAAPVADIEVIEKPGLGIDDGIILTTFFLLVGALALVWFANQTYLPNG
ncbi:MAG: hypothetical protein H6838_05810 [Planctomycetes bacterium]|nr:hypothetical protein [Planctomycetota bacterium]